MLAVYVDDLAWLSNDGALLNKCKNRLGRQFPSTDLGELRWFLGMRIQRAPGIVTIDQSAYIAETLERFGMTNCNSLSTPIDASNKLTKEQAPKNSAEREFMSKVPYRNAVGTLMYLAVSTRPDIAAAVGMVARFVENPGPRHWLAVKRILRYLQGTRDHGLRYTLDGPIDEVVGYCDADWGNNIDDRKSVTGYVFLLGGGAVAWQSKRQPTVALSSTEAEYMAAAAATKEALWLRGVMSFIGLAPWGATTIYSDSQGAMGMIKSDAVKTTSKHIDIRAHFIRDHVSKGDVNFVYKQTKEMVADVLTKGISADQHRRLREELGVHAINTLVQRSD